MKTPGKCPECGATLTNEQTCEGYFHQMLFWEAEYPVYGAEVHHLTVLCYYLQHPSLYSPAGLKAAQQLLVKFVEQGASPAEVRRRNRARVDSSRRAWKITGTADSQGSYEHAISWKMTAADVVAGGSEHYCDKVRTWARLITEALKAL